MAKITIDLDLCDGEGDCVAVCPTNVYKIEPNADYDGALKSVAMSPDDCILCMVCVSACPKQAITVEE